MHVHATIIFLCFASTLLPSDCIKVLKWSLTNIENQVEPINHTHAKSTPTYEESTPARNGSSPFRNGGQTVRKGEPVCTQS